MRVSGIAALLFTVATVGSAAQMPVPLTSANQPEFASSEDGCADGRIQDYILRHSDRGIIDPFVMLELSRDIQRTLEGDRHRKAPLAIGGDVWNSIGPANGAGRATAIAADPTVANSLIVGAAGGGAWKTTDGGATWTPLTETIPNLSVGAIAIASSSTSTVYLGTGEGGYAVDFVPGIGLLASTDGGGNWTLPDTVLASKFYKISVHPTSPLELVVATNAGAKRSTNGQNGPWQTVIQHDGQVGVPGYGDVTDLVRDPTNPSVLYAATWDDLVWCAYHGPCSTARNFASSTVLKSTDGGQTWAPANGGLPVSTATQYVSRIALAIAPSSPSTLYAAMSILDTASNGLSHIYKSTNGGASWIETSLSSNNDVRINHYHQSSGDQDWYDNTMVVSPTDPNVVIAGGVSYVRSIDGGATWSRAFNSTGTSVHVDAHELRYDAAGALFIANDGGIWKSTDSGVSATDRNAGLITRQYYTLVNDASNRNRLFGGMQDNGTNRRGDAGGTAWDFVAGGDGFGCTVIPTVPSIVVVSYQNVVVNRSNGATDTSPNLIDVTPILAAGEHKPFSTLVVNDPATPPALYTGTNRLWKSTNGGETWLPVPTTTTDGSVWDLASGHEVRAIAVSRSNPSILMVAKGYDTAGNTSRPAIFRSSDGGNSWAMANNGLPIKNAVALEIDPANPNIAYVAFAGVTGTSVYKTINGGTFWSPSGSGLPSFSAQVVRVDPTDSNTLYCGTDVGVYRSTDQGATWLRFGSGMPAVSVYDIRALNDGSILRAVTHGRGAWELAVTGVTNHPPTASISTPALPTMIAMKGVPISFIGSISDPDSGDSATALWTFPDTWETSTALSTSHTFVRAGIFPVTLLATDTHGATASATVGVKVLESGDDCNSAVVIPGGGPFPWSASINTEGASPQTGDPGFGASPASCYPYRPYTTVWFNFTPQASGTYDFYSCGSRVATVLEIWNGAGCGPYTAVASGCQTNFSPKADCSSDTKLSVALTAGTTYRVLVEGYYYQGPITLTVAQGAFTTQVARISPSSGSAAGGTSVTIEGSGFAAPATVTIGGSAATDVNVVSPSLITAVTAAHAAATADLSVSSGGSTAMLGSAFTYIGTNTACQTGASQLCFVGNRYAVSLSASDTGRTGKSGGGEANAETIDTGYFTLSALTGNNQNPEVVVKVIEIAPGQPWIFFGGLTDLEYFLNVLDTQSGRVRQYHKFPGTVQNGFDTGGGQAPAPETTPGSVCPLTPLSVTTSSVAPAPCIASANSLCLFGNRFRVEVTAKDAGRTNNTGPGLARPKNDIFGFFSVPALTANTNNQEIFIKILDARSIGGKFWIFYGTLSDFEFTVKVTDTQTGQVKTYFRPGQTSCGAADTSAFPF